MPLAAVLLLEDTSSAALLVGGLPLAVRHIKELSRLGIKGFYVVGTAHVPPYIQRVRWRRDITLYAVARPAVTLPQCLQALPAAATDLLLVRGDCLIDPRLLATLVTQASPRWLRAPQSAAEAMPAAARIPPAGLAVWAATSLATWLHDSVELDPAAMDDYSAAHRGPVPFYLHTVKTPTEAVAATKTLIRAAQKRALDLPALVLNPLFENRLVFWLCHTPITPNQVTLFTAVLGALIAVLFLNGWLRLGTLLAYAVEILDGVDGKLARTRLQTSRLGELEHVLDFFVEHAWYLAITVFLATSTGNRMLWWTGGGLMLCDLGDNLLYGLGRGLFGKHLDELGRFDRLFRLIAGRRNIYAWMFCFGFWAGFPVATLVMVFCWALTTVMIHGGRLAYHIYWYSNERSPSVTVQ